MNINSVAEALFSLPYDLSCDPLEGTKLLCSKPLDCTAHSDSERVKYSSLVSGLTLLNSNFYAVGIPVASLLEELL